MSLTLDLHLPYIESSAWLSADGRYRHRLTRRWAGGPALMVVGLNPSTADAVHDDQTIRREKRFARTFGYGALDKFNLYDYRATDPAELVAAGFPVSAVNDSALDAAAGCHDLIVFAWGAQAQPQRARAVASRLWRICCSTGAAVGCLGWTANGQPRHPSRLASDSVLRTVTAGAHADFADIDPRWSRLLADTEGDL